VVSDEQPDAREGQAGRAGVTDWACIRIDAGDPNDGVPQNWQQRIEH